MPLSKRKQGQTAILSKRKTHLYNVFKNSRRIGGVLTGDDTLSKLELAYYTMLGLGVNRTELLTRRMAKERNNDLPNAMKEHLNKKSVTIEVQSAQDENMEECEKNKFESRFIVVHVYVVVNDGELPSNPDTPWKVTGITLRNTQSVFS